MDSTARYIALIVVTLAVAGCSSEVTFSVPDMMCEESCAVKVHEVLSKQAGVKRVNVDFPSRTATLAVNQSKFDADQAIAALVDHGFEEARLRTGDSPAKTPSAPSTSSTTPASDAVPPAETPASEINL